MNGMMRDGTLYDEMEPCHAIGENSEHATYCQLSDNRLNLDLGTGREDVQMHDPVDNQFFANIIAAGAVVASFCAVFLQFRIQREADYYRNPSHPEPLNLQQFSSSFFLIILTTVLAFIFGVILPLLRLSGLGANWIKVQCVVAGLLDTIALLAFYFLDELVHYRICRINRCEWLRELPVVLAAMFVGILLPVLWVSCLH
jgi:hypothetical protein